MAIAHFPVSELRAVHHRVDLDGELPAAVPATVRLGGMRAGRVYIVAFAERAPDTVRPSGFDEPPLGGSVVGEHLEQFHEVDAVAVGLAGSLSHLESP